MQTYRLCLTCARVARLMGDNRERDFWLAEAMLTRWAMLGNPTWFTRESLRDWNIAHSR